ncbi:MAG: putative rane protein [Parcubacteria group bacterium]|nr:putative rane protein [Parcubacteria group bacterium]
MKPRNPIFMRNLIFGIEDSLVSTVGLLAGLATQAASVHQLLATGTIYVFVEGFSMSVGSYLSEESAEEYVAGSNVSNRIAITGAGVMFVTFIIAGFVPILPYLIFTNGAALGGSIFVSVGLLAILGFVQAQFSKVSPWSRALRAAIFGGLAIGVGVLVGKLFGVS